MIMKHLNKNKLNVQEMNISEMRITDGGLFGIKITPRGVANFIDHAYKAYKIYTQVQTANTLPKPNFSPISVPQVTK